MSDGFQQPPLRAEEGDGARIEDMGGPSRPLHDAHGSVYANPDATPLTRDRGGVFFGGQHHVRPALPEIERGVLWRIMEHAGRDDAEPGHQAVGLLTAGAFDQFENRLVFEAVAGSVNAGEMPSLAAVCARLRQLGNDRAVTRAFEIATGEFRSLDFTNHCLLLLGEKLKRDHVELMTRLGGAALDPTQDALELQDALERAVYEIAPKAARRHIKRAGDVTQDVLDQYAENAEGDRSLIGISTGFAKLDKHTRGHRGGKMYVALAAPGMGKTVFGLGCAREAAVAEGVGTAYFSVEMPAQELTDRLVCMDAGVDAEAAAEGRLLAADWRLLREAKARIDAAPLWIDSTPRLQIDHVESQIRRLVRFEGVRFVVIDYLQRVSYEGHAENYERGISYVSSRLKLLALELGIPILVLSQITREKAKEGKEPTQHDARGSGDVENDADVIYTIWRPERVGVEFVEQHQMLSAGLVIIGLPKCRGGREFRTVGDTVERCLAHFDAASVRFLDQLPPGQAGLFGDMDDDVPF